MVDKDKRKFLDEIYFIGEQKEFKELFGKMVNPLNFIKKTDEILSDKRKAYNYAFCSCCEKYKIQNIDNIYKDFDDIWSQSKDLELKDLLMPAILGHLALRGLAGPLGFLSGSIVKYQQRIMDKWNSYISMTRDYAKKLDDS
jgi:hypothetical protein